MRTEFDELRAAARGRRGPRRQAGRAELDRRVDCLLTAATLDEVFAA